MIETLKKTFLVIMYCMLTFGSCQAQAAKLTDAEMAAVISVINMFLLSSDTEKITLALDEFDSANYPVTKNFELQFEQQVEAVDICFVLSANGPFSLANISIEINGQALSGIIVGENCFSVPLSSQQAMNSFTILIDQVGLKLTLSNFSVEHSIQSVLNLPILTRAAWNERAVRKVLKIFAFGGHALDQQIQLWGNMPPKIAIEEMLNFNEHNLKLSPVLLGDNYAETASQFGTLTEFTEDYLASPAALLPMPYEDDGRGRFGLDRYDFEGAFTRMATVRGLNPFRQRIGLWETNYHLAVNLNASVNHYQMARFYDVIMEAHESGVPYQQILAQAAKTAAVAMQYGHRRNIWVNDPNDLEDGGTCYCNDDFAREIHQLYFGIFGSSDPDYHENISIRNTAKMLTGMEVEYDQGLERYPDIVNFTTGFHHSNDLEILESIINGVNASNKIDSLVDVSIEHPESLDNLPIMIISGLADDNLSATAENQLREAWASMGSDKNFLVFIRAYAVSQLFHAPEQYKYLTSFERNFYLANRYNIDNIEALYGYRYGLGDYIGRPVEAMLDAENVEVFRPEHNVFGGQTSLEAADAAIIFENSYNQSTARGYQWRNAVECETCDAGVAWIKDWTKVIPAVGGSYPVEHVARWLWLHVVGNLDNYTSLERAHLLAILGAVRSHTDPQYNQNLHFDLSLLMCIRQERVADSNTTDYSLTALLNSANSHCTDYSGGYSVTEQALLNTSYTTAQINAEPINSLMDSLAIQDMPLLSTDTNLRRHAAERIHYALAFIYATPFVFAVGGQ